MSSGVAQDEPELPEGDCDPSRTRVRRTAPDADEYRRRTGNPENLILDVVGDATVRYERIGAEDDQTDRKEGPGGTCISRCVEYLHQEAIDPNI